MSGKICRKIKFALSVTVLMSLFFPLAPKDAFAAGASLYFSPSSGTFFVGSTFDVSVFVNTGENDINAVGVDIKFDPKKIQIANPTTGRSFISVWVAQPVYSNIVGTASFQGGVPSPGINTSSGLVSTITFRAIAPGETRISFLNSSRVLLNDGAGTDILSSKSGGVYNITIPPPEGPIVFSPSHPDQNKWYRNNSPSFSWEKEEGVTDYSYSIDTDFSGVPDNISEGNQTSVSFTDMKDGIWYFHIKAKKGSAWGGVSHYVIQIDQTPPAAFGIDFEPKLRSPVMTSREPIISFITTDTLSGINHYEIKSVYFGSSQKGEASFFTETASPYKLPLLEPGEHEVIVRAFDEAGNWRDASSRIEVIPVEKIFYFTRKGVGIWIFFFPWWQILLFLLILLLLILLLLTLWWKKNKKLVENEKTIAEIKKQLEKEAGNFHEQIHDNQQQN